MFNSLKILGRHSSNEDGQYTLIIATEVERRFLATICEDLVDSSYSCDVTQSQTLSHEQLGD